MHSKQKKGEKKTSFRINLREHLGDLEKYLRSLTEDYLCCVCCCPRMRSVIL